MAEPSARPARAPDYRLTVDGQIITPRVRGRLSRLTLTDQRGQESDRLDLTLTDHDGRLTLPPRGATIALALGWRHTGLVDRGTYTVDEVEHAGAPDTISIRARAADLRAGLPTKRTHSWHQTTAGDIVETIAQRHGLDPRIADTLRGRAVEHLDQTEESDMNFLTRLAERFDAAATVKAGRLLFLPAGAAATVGGLAIPEITLTRRQGDRHRYTVTDRDTYTGVAAHWQDIEAAEKKRELAGTEDRVKTLRKTYATQAEARAAARAEHQRIRRSEGALTLTLAEGRADLYPETPVRTDGYKPPIDATPWLLTEVRHALTESAYTCDLSLEVRED